MDECKYKVSIITAVYNGAKTIEQTIQSVLGQTYTNIEYIIIDGGSYDGTQQIVKKYENSIAHFISESDNGIYDAMNKGIRYATGDIIGIINSDDWYASDAVENVVNCFMNENTDIVYGKLVLVYFDGEKKMNPKLPLDSLWYQMAVPHPTAFIKRAVYEKYGIFSLKYRLAADYDLILRFYSKHLKFTYIDNIIAYFRSGGRSMQNGLCQLDEHTEIFFEHISDCPDKEIVIENYRELYKWTYFLVNIQLKKEILSRMLKEYFHSEIRELIIFGSGRRGKYCYEILQDSGIDVIFWVDNDSSKWNQRILQTKVLCPDKLKNIESYILIAIDGKESEIEHQLELLNNNNLKWVSLKELELQFYRLREAEENENIWYGKKYSSNNSTDI